MDFLRDLKQFLKDHPYWWVPATVILLFIITIVLSQSHHYTEYLRIADSIDVSGNCE